MNAERNYYLGHEQGISICNLGQQTFRPGCNELLQPRVVGLLCALVPLLKLDGGTQGPPVGCVFGPSGQRTESAPLESV